MREVTDLRIRRRPGPYRVYLLEKQGWNTADALGRIAAAHGVPLRLFAYGGKKDRHGHTWQYVTVASDRDVSTAAPGFRLTFLGWSDEPMAPARILYNEFQITVRDLCPAEAQALAGGLERVGGTGVANYFDDQRFGSYDRERGFVMAHALAGRWDQALAIALTAIYPEEHRQAKARKRALRERWGDWQACRALAATAFERRAFDLLLREPGNFQGALALAPAEQRGLWVAALQSHLWNDALRRLLQARGWVRYAHPGRAGPYLFYGPDADLGYLHGLTVPLPGQGMRLPQPEVREALAGAAAALGLDLAAVARAPGFAASPRPAAVAPQGLAVAGPHPDERYPGRLALTLRFALPRGCYATMVVKAAAARPV